MMLQFKAGKNLITKKFIFIILYLSKYKLYSNTKFIFLSINKLNL
jgi:hypothetical protein